jgi:hypothetical protein
MFDNALQDKMHKKYDLGPIKKETNQDNHPQTKEVGESSNIEREVKELEESVPSFNIENKLSMIKIPMPLMELSRNPSCHKKIKKVIQVKGSISPLDTVCLQHEYPTIVCVPHIDEKEEAFAPFYVTLNIHDKMLHNCMLDSGASHSLMPKVVMEKMGL